MGRDLSALVDASKTGHPIGKHMYGQFIERMGRCIQGGIWAEMLLDREFLHSVREDASPWRPIGSCMIDMATHDAYVGQHAVQVHLIGKPGGIVQGGLGVKEGGEYEGRAIISGDAAAGPIEVALVWGREPRQRQTIRIDDVPDDYTVFPLRFRAGADTAEAGLTIIGLGSGSFRVGTVSLMSADNVLGTIPVEVTGDHEPLYLAAAWTEDREALTVAVVNPLDEAVVLLLEMRGTELTGEGACWTITGADVTAYIEAGKEAQVRIEEDALGDALDRLDIPPLSVRLYRLETQD